MPTYDYGCEACGANWELEQRITEDPIKKCPKCGKKKAKRLISGGNFILKGSGWYADLYHKPKSGGGSSSNEDSSGSSEAKSEPKSEAKTETTSESKADAPSKPKKKGKKAASS